MTINVIHGLAELSQRPTGCVVTIGNFDGVHRGHQRILSTARRLADDVGGPVVAVSFQPSPVQLLAPDKAPEALMQISQRCDALTDAGADIVLLLHTSVELLAMTPEAFVREILVDRLGARHVVEGGNFFFGHNRAGSVETLAAFGELLGFGVHVVEAVTVDLADATHVTVSSSLTRRLLTDGRVADAARCLGRPYRLSGEVVRGRGLGRRLDYHTANLDCGRQLIPADGVYAARAVCEGRTYSAAVSIGTRPTFGDLDRAVEAHLLADPGDVYHCPMTLEFVGYIREQITFDSPDHLRLQIDEDVQRVRDQLR